MERKDKTSKGKDGEIERCRGSMKRMDGGAERKLGSKDGGMDRKMKRTDEGMEMKDKEEV